MAFFICHKISIYSSLSALFMLLTAQNFPHIEQLSSCSGALLSRMLFAVSASIAHSHCFSQSKVRLASAIASSVSLASVRIIKSCRVLAAFHKYSICSSISLCWHYPNQVKGSKVIPSSQPVLQAPHCLIVANSIHCFL